MTATRNPSKNAFTKLQNEAIQFVMASHWTQRRKTTVLPYIVHPIEVASFVGRLYPDNQDLVIAAYLHDVLEDTEATPESVSNRFGPRVLELVEGVTAHGAKTTWREHRQGQMDKLKTSEPDVVRLKACDMLSNASSIGFDFELLFGSSDNTFDKFKGDASDVRWYYRGAWTIIHSRLGNEPIVAELLRAITRFRA